MMRSQSFLLLAMGILLVACWSSGPADIVEEFHSRVEEGKLDSAMELLSATTRSQVPAEKIKQGLQQATRAIDAKGGIKSFTVEEEKIIGETAEVTVRIKFGDESEELDQNSLIKENGEWKLQPSFNAK